jgi:ribosomal protein L32
MDKPFPWWCCYCDTKTVQPVIRDWSTEVKRNSKLHTVNLKGIEMPTCSSCGSEFVDLHLSRKIEEELLNMGVTRVE